MASDSLNLLGNKAAEVQETATSGPAIAGLHPPPAHLGLSQSQMPIFNYVQSMDRKQKDFIAECMKKEEQRKTKAAKKP